MDCGGRMKKFVITYETISVHDIEVELDDDFFDNKSRGDDDIPECDGSTSTYEQECLPIHAYDMEGNEVWTR